MNSLTVEQKKLVFDYCLNLTSQEERTEAEKLISSLKGAKELHGRMNRALSPLEIVEEHQCPDDLMEKTIARLNEAARSSHIQLEQLINSEQRSKRSPRSWGVWRGIGELLAAAAVILFFTGILVPPLKHARQKAWQQQCQMQLSQIGGGIDLYRGDNDGKMPSVTSQQGEPWWKVGYQGEENHSNTRQVWLLVRNGYVKPHAFVCPGRREGRTIQFDTKETNHYNDFPDKRYITYSMRIECRKPLPAQMSKRRVLISDSNPLFENLPRTFSEKLLVKLNEDLLKLNSINHRRHGQNILFSDGEVRFIRSRLIGAAEDDIFTLQDIETYSGVEFPNCDTDAFLAP